MLEDFIVYWNSLPKPLDKVEQEMLFFEMDKMKNEYAVSKNESVYKKYLAIREKLITYNLRLCADFAIKYCQKHNRLKDVEDIYSECVIGLTNAIDDYEQCRGTSFISVAYKYINTRLLNIFLHSRNDALNLTDDTHILNKDQDEVGDGIFSFLSDDENIAENYGQNEFVKDIINYTESIENESHRVALKMSIGLGYKRKYTQIEIAKVLGYSRSTISKIILFEKEKLKEYIASHYPLSFPCITKGMKPEKFETDAEKEQYIFDSYFGLHGLAKKSTMALSQEMGKSLTWINSIINKLLNTLSEESRKELQLDEIKQNKIIKYDDDFLISILNDYYGLENNQILSIEEILKKYHLNSKSILNNLILKAKKKFNIEEINQLNQKRKVYRDKKLLERSALCYYMNKGLKGYDKTSQLGIEKKLGIGRNAVARSIKYYQEYLDSLTPEEREKVLSEDVVSEQ